MTVAPTGGGNVPATNDDLDTGLGDFGIEDAVVPRLNISHKDASFKDSLTNETFTSIQVIFLGLVKQRVLFHFKVDDGDKPMCKSPDHKHGFPNVDEDTKKDKRFPWDRSGFEPQHFPADDNGIIMLGCDGCQLKEWGSHPDGNKPYCSEQFTMPILYDPYGNGNWVPAIMSFAKTALKPLKSYLTAFQRGGNAAYEAVTEITLRTESRGSNEYCVPIFRRVGDTDTTEYRGYSQNFRMMKSFLEAFPGSREETEDVPEAPAAPTDNVARPPEPVPETQQTATQTETKATESAPSPEPTAAASPAATPPAPADDDDLPF